MQALANEFGAATDEIVLPDDLEECHALIASLKELLLKKDSQLQKRESDLEKLKHHLQNLLRNKYGRSTEKINPDQLLLFAEALLDQSEKQIQPDPNTPSPTNKNKRTKRGGGGRNPLPEDLPTEEKDHFPERRNCKCCGTEMTEFSVEVSDQLDFIPANFKIIRHRVHKFSCQKCHGDIAQGKKPEQIHSGGQATEGLLAHIAVAKHVDHSPLERQSNIYARQGVTISVSTMGRWMRMTAESLRLISNRMHELVLLSRLLEADESPFDFIDKKRVLKKIKQGFFWVYYGDEDHPYIVFDFQTDRTKDRPKKFLTGFDGFLLTDGYGGYIWYNQDKALNCNVHCRRNFEKALKANKKEAAFALAIYQKLYAIEAEIRQLSEQKRLEIRQERSVPLLDQFHTWLLEKSKTEQPKTALGHAISYALDRWEKLTRFTKHGFLKMDTNLVENSIRPHAITRKNCLFAGSETGGETAAIITSITSTCKRLGINPYEYIKDVLTRLGANPNANIDEMLPDRWKPIALPP